MDHLNTHKIASLYEVFPPENARSPVNRLEIHYTPKHGSWLNIAEVELSVLKGQCLSNRIDCIEKFVEKYRPGTMIETTANHRLTGNFAHRIHELS